MWPGFDPRVWRDLATIRETVALRHQTPRNEWPLIYVRDHRAVLVVREWPDGTITAYALDNPPS